MERQYSTEQYFDSLTFDLALARARIRTITALAQKVGVSRSRMYLVRAGYKPTRALQARIAQALGVAAEELWPRLPGR